MIFRKAIYPITVSLFLTACNGGGGDSGDDTSSNTSSSSTNNGITVTVMATPQQSPDAVGQIPKVPAGAKTFRNSENTQITLSKAYLVMWSVQLETDCQAHNFTKLFNFLLPAAQAHAEATPTKLDTPNVINLLAEDSVEIKLGTIQPPPNTYCGVSIEFAKADEDAHGLPEDVNMVNRTVYLEGQYSLSGSNNSGVFTLDTAKTLLPKYALLKEPLNLSASNLSGRVSVSVRYDRWFDGLNLPVLATDEAQQDLLFSNLNFSVKP